MIYIVRHGQTELNQAKVLQGRSNRSLNETGQAQASALGERFRAAGIAFDRVYSSPLRRAVETARLIAGIDPTVDDRLLEMDYGPYEGMDLTNPVPEVLAFFRDFVNVPAPDGMEQLSSVVERSGQFIEEVKVFGRDHNILITTHAIAMKGILEYLTPESRGAYWSTHVANCEVYSCEVINGRFTVPKPCNM
ncbi:MAG: histidine phosphatase family protein [Mogibacterium sp.]|nr:histidine phosphatase family protein [Mogibacterium sp.]